MKDLSIIGYEHYAATESGDIVNMRNGNIIKPMSDIHGYRYVCLSQSGKKKRIAVHRLVMIAFEGFIEGKPVVNHIDGDKANNAHSNLEWTTYAENAQHTIDAGLRTKFKNEYRMYSDELIHKVCKMIQENHRTCDIVKELAVPTHLVCNVRKGFQYKEVSSQYDFTKIYPVQKRIGYARIEHVCELLEEGSYTGAEISRMTGVSQGSISRIKNKLDYTIVSDKYNF